MLRTSTPSRFGAVVLDESSILKALDGKTRQKLTAMFAATPYRLVRDRDPAPNDIVEIGNHSEFLGMMPHHEMLLDVLRPRVARQRQGRAGASRATPRMRSSAGWRRGA